MPSIARLLLPVLALLIALAAPTGADDLTNQRADGRSRYAAAGDAAARRAVLAELRRMRREAAESPDGPPFEPYQPERVRRMILDFPQPWRQHEPRFDPSVATIYDVTHVEDASALAEAVAHCLEQVEPELLGDDRKSSFAVEYRAAIAVWRDMEDEFHDVGGHDLTDAEVDALEDGVNRLRTLMIDRAPAYAEARLRDELLWARRDAERARKALLRTKQLAFLAGDAAEMEYLPSLIDNLGTLVGLLGEALDDLGRTPWWQTDLPVYGAPLVSLGVAYRGWASSSPLRAGSALDTFTDLQNLGTALSLVNGLKVNPLTLFTAHVGPILTVIGERLDALQRHLIEENELWERLGYEAPYPDAWPGGRAMNDYLVAVFAADDALDAPGPEGAALEYFDGFRDRFETFVGAPIPTRGTVFTSVDPIRFRSWIVEHREDVWELLYGPRRKPNG